MESARFPTVIFSTAELAQELGALACLRLGLSVLPSLPGTKRMIGVQGSFDPTNNRLVSVTISIHDSSTSQEVAHEETEPPSPPIPSPGAPPSAKDPTGGNV